ncbi:HupE/UreJ family protein [Nitrosomonas sp. Is24]|uniref:HupE/UreJ family protein n=1 Tax=Nitrosomonas sp. Is24 TaxID=3080533 RepID=UPI00294B8A1D|nr:HupE/UreJ family protein [Nitrosomonas sp. Is24]MDV6341321.1 HupE/UreJ family protein [Nitrosomonas sp. Is24]
MKKTVPPLKFFWLLLLIIPILIASPLAFAHTGDGPHNGWLHGFAHPLSGLDHMLAMIAVGLWAAQAHGRIVWLFPLIFVVVMGLGGLFGAITLPLAFAEHGIMLSLVMLGALLVWRKHLPLSVSLLLIGLFALSHGYAHGSEMPPSISLPSYAGGFMLATMLLHLCGIGLALLCKKFAGTRWIRFSGIIIAGYGGFLLIP